MRSRPPSCTSHLRNSSEFRLRFADRVQKHLVQRRRLDGRGGQAAMAGAGRPNRGGDHRRIGPLGRRPRGRGRQRAADRRHSADDRRSLARLGRRRQDGYIPQHHSLALSRLQADGLFADAGRAGVQPVRRQRAAGLRAHACRRPAAGRSTTRPTARTRGWSAARSTPVGHDLLRRRADQRHDHRQGPHARRLHLERADRSHVCRLAGHRRHRHQRDQLPPARPDRRRVGRRARRERGRLRLHRRSSTRIRPTRSAC